MAFLSLQSFLAGVSPDEAASAPRQVGGLRPEAPAFVPRGLRLPAVVSVRKSASKGCAVVLLRDLEVLERSVRQRVAVVDRVCVEVKRHSRKEREANPEGDAGEATPTTACSSREASPRAGASDAVGGVFVAWGHRVERRMPVSEEGLEAYFNGLAGAPEAPGLEPQPPFEEQLQRFSLSSSNAPALEAKPAEESAVAARLLEGPHGDEELVQGLWRAKEALDSLWAKPPPPMGRNLCQRVARDQLFPYSGKEGRDGHEHENRAGEKLAELAAASGLLDGLPRGACFLDLCGGPGAWSQFLLARRDLAIRGFGFTLRSSTGGAQDWKAEEKDDWYPELLEQPSWRALWGADGTGDLLKPGNLEHCAGEVKRAGGALLCVADGGFSDQAIPANLLELYFYRLLLAELLTAASCLQPGGRFICKLYSSFSAHTSGLLLLATRLFESVSVVKPKSSRVAGPERYLVALGFRGQTAEVRKVVAALACSHDRGDGAGVLQLPLLSPVVPPSAWAAQTDFVEGLRAMVHGLCRRQTLALTSIFERAELLESAALEASAHAAAAAPAARKSPWEAEASPAAAAAANPRSAEREHREHRGRGRRGPPAAAQSGPAAQRYGSRPEAAAPQTLTSRADARAPLRPQRGAGRKPRKAAEEAAAYVGKSGKPENQSSHRVSWDDGMEGLLDFGAREEKVER